MDSPNALPAGAWPPTATNGNRFMNPRVVFFGDSESVFSNRHYRAVEHTPCTIAGVVDTPPAQRTSTNKDRGRLVPFPQAAAARDIPVLAPATPNEPAVVAAVRQLGPDLLLAVGYSLLLGPAMLALPRLAAVNFHASLLPAYRGKHPVFWALRHGEKRAGLTVHLMTARLDGGDVLYQVQVRSRRDDTVATLYDRIMDRSEPLVSRLVRDASAGRLRPRPQSAAGASYFSSTRPEDFRLDWARDAEQLRRWVATSPGRCYFRATGQRVLVLSAQSDCRAGGASPGTLTGLGKRYGLVATARGALRVGQVREGQSTPEWMAHWCRRRSLSVGTQLA